jgi:hypothetical protein
MAKRFLSLAFGALAASATRDAAADKAFVDRPLTLPMLHFSADAGIGFGQYQDVQLDAAGNVASTSMKVGWGSNLEAAVGLPFLGEFGARVGYRFDDAGVKAGWGLGADHFARLFDPVVEEPGGSQLSNPELRLRGSLLDVEVLQLGLETRAIIPTGANSSFELTPGIPVRIHVPGFMRIDTGVFFPIEFTSDTGYTIDIPAQLFFQVEDAFFGPMLGFRFNHPGSDGNPAPPPPATSTDIPAGLGGGYTLGGVVDLKLQVRTERINDANWSRFIGAGFGVGLRLP